MSTPLVQPEGPKRRHVAWSIIAIFLGGGALAIAISVGQGLDETREILGHMKRGDVVTGIVQAKKNLDDKVRFERPRPVVGIQHTTRSTRINSEGNEETYVSENTTTWAEFDLLQDDGSLKTVYHGGELRMGSSEAQDIGSGNTVTEVVVMDGDTLTVVTTYDEEGRFRALDRGQRCYQINRHQRRIPDAGRSGGVYRRGLCRGRRQPRRLADQQP